MAEFSPPVVVPRARITVPAAYALSMVTLVAAVLLRYVLDPWMGSTLPLVTLFGAVAAAVWIGGYRPAIAVVILGYLACHYLFIDPRGRVEFRVADMIGLIAYLFTCSLIITFGHVTRIAHRRANERREALQVTLQSIGDAVITTDIECRVSYMNPMAETVTGWSQGDAINRPLDAVFRIVNEQTRRPVENPATKALREGIVVGLANHTILIRKDGSECPIDDSAAPITDEQGKVSGCVLIFRDVTVARRIERDKARQLHTARLLASIVESSDDAIISKSLDGTIQSWNAAAERLFGVRADEAVGRHISLIIPPERLPEEADIIARLTRGERIDHFETERMRADGSLVPVSLTISPIKDDAGQVVGASKIARDVTRQRQADAERERLEHSLRSLAASLSEADQRKNEFLAMLAHELRNPLAPISNAARVLRLGSSDRDALRSASDTLDRQIGQMARLVDDLLDMSRITRGKIELRKERIELAPIVQQAVEAVRTQYTCMEHELTVAVPPQPLFLDADPARVAQIVGNLLNNACKFTDRGGRVRLTVEEDGSHAVIRVRDNGIGVAAEHLPRLFDMFVQVDTSLERSRDGLGIGLTLVKTLVDMHGGTVEVHSEGLGRGSEFVVRLPILVGVRTPAARPATTQPPPPVPRRILIVDDSEDGAESLALLLAFAGHETHKAHDGLAAVEAAERVRPDAILLDIGLPKINGYEACRRIRTQPWGKDMVLVALTGWGQDEDRQQAQEAGFDVHMVKPVDHDALLEFLATLPSIRKHNSEINR